MVSKAVLKELRGFSMEMPVTFFYNKHFLRSVMIVLTLAALMVSMLSSVAAHAAGGKALFSLQPAVYDSSNPVTKSYFVLNLKPSTTTSLSFRVINSGTAAGAVNLYAVDATTSQNSGTAFRSHTEPRTDVGSWITLHTSHLTLAAGQSQTVLFTVTVPANVRPGQHLGGIRAEGEDAQQSTTQNGHFQIKVYNQFAMAVQVNMPGPAIEQLNATGILPGGANDYQKLQVQLSNIGTVMVKGNGSLQVADVYGRLLQNVPINLDTFLPNTSISYPAAVQKKALAPGDYQATLDLTYGHSHVLHYVTKFTITQDQVNQVFSNGPLQAPGSGSNFLNSMPLWQIILVALAAIIVLLMGGQKLYGLVSARRRKQTRNSLLPKDGSNQPIDIAKKKRDKIA